VLVLVLLLLFERRDACLEAFHLGAEVLPLGNKTY
jgi:hypothetical protein